MKRTYRYRIYLTRAQITYLLNVLSMCRHLYNWNLKERIDVYQSEGRTVGYLEQQNKLPALKKERPWFASVYSLVLQDVLRRLDKAYKKFFSQKKGFPKFKKRGQWSSITYSNYHKRPEDNTIVVPNLGCIKMVKHRDIPQNAEIKTLSLVKEGDKWFACFSVDIPDSTEPKPMPTTFAGIDLGLRSFAYLSDGAAPIVAPKPLRRCLNNLQKLQRRLSRAKKRSPLYYKLLKSLQKAYYRISCKRQGFLYQVAADLFRKFDFLAAEDLNILSMVKHPDAIQDKETGQYLPNGASKKARFNRAIYDASWRKFLDILTNKAEAFSKWFCKVNPFRTTQECSQCKKLVVKSLSTRTHCCCHCGYTADRDFNAATNILRLGLESLGFPLEAPTITLCV